MAADCAALEEVLARVGPWDSDGDPKLLALLRLLRDQHPEEKVLLFTQFADTVTYLESQLERSGLERLGAVTGNTPDPTELAWRFSPRSNNKTDVVSEVNELRVLVTTDVLSEGQNLQDASIVVNFDLPWAIIRLIQRAGRVDRIGQRSPQILCYSFLPADGSRR